MSASAELARKWEGRVIDGKFPLRQWLGGSDHSDVFLTQRAGTAGPENAPQEATQKAAEKAAIKIIPAAGRATAAAIAPDAQLLRWADAVKLSDPHLIRLFEQGQCEIDGQRFLYVVMEYAEENLAEILPSRALSTEEAREMLRPTAEALAALHGAGWVHGRIKPSNIMAVGEQLKISSDGLAKPAESAVAPSPYEAPEIATTGLSAPADVWSVGSTLLTALTQGKASSRPRQGSVAIPETIPQPLREIARQCLQVDPQQRCNTADILKLLAGGGAPTARESRPPISPARLETQTRPSQPKRWIAAATAILILLAVILIARRFMGHAPTIPEKPASSGPAPVEIPPAKPAPFSGQSARSGAAHGSVVQQVLPEVSRSALNTIRGRVKVSVKVDVDSSGNVSRAAFVSGGPSRYFAERSLAAARRWKFNPPQVNGQAAASEWILKFQFRRSGPEVISAEVRP